MDGSEAGGSGLCGRRSECDRLERLLTEVRSGRGQVLVIRGDAGVPLYPHPNDSFGLNLLGPTLLHWGTEDQKQRFLPPTLDSSIRWAQGYSEPDAGSDLFNLRTRGEVVGDELVLNGQKTWQSAGLTANWLFTLVRTDPTAARSRGPSRTTRGSSTRCRRRSRCTS